MNYVSNSLLIFFIVKEALPSYLNYQIYAHLKDDVLRKVGNLI